MRLGELLLQRRIITRAQLQGALDAQGVYGRRIGTNLVHLGYLDLDVLARALSEQQGIPAVLREHVATIDRRLVQLFQSLAPKHRAMPIGYTQTKPPRVLMACEDPKTLATDELSFAGGFRIEPCLAPELLIDECLERYYGVARAPTPYVSLNFGAAPARYPSSGKVKAQAAPVPSPAPAAVKKRESLKGLSPPPPPPSSALSTGARVLEPPPPPAPAPRFLEPPPPPPPPPPAAVGDSDRSSDADPEPSSELQSEAPQSLESIPFGHGISISEAPPPPPQDPPAAPFMLAASLMPPAVSATPVSAPPDALRPVIDHAEATRMLEMATTKDHIGRVLEDWLRSTFGCGLVLVVKSDMAVGWKGYFPDAEDLIEAVAVPLGKPSVLKHSFDSGEAFHGAPAAEDAKANQLLWKLLRVDPPAEVLVCPVVLNGRTINLLYAHTEEGASWTPTFLEEATALAKETAAAYARLIRKKTGGGSGSGKQG